MVMPVSLNSKHTNRVVGLVEVRSLRVVSCSSLVDSTDSVLVLVVLHQVGDFLPGVSDGAFHHLDKEIDILMPVISLASFILVKQIKDLKIGQ